MLIVQLKPSEITILPDLSFKTHAQYIHYPALRKSMKEMKGLIVPLIVDRETKTLIDGHVRLRIWRELYEDKPVACRLLDSLANTSNHTSIAYRMLYLRCNGFYSAPPPIEWLSRLVEDVEGAGLNTNKLFPIPPDVIGAIVHQRESKKEEGQGELFAEESKSVEESEKKLAEKPKEEKPDDSRGAEEGIGTLPGLL